jgi:hypothetical protein
MIVKSGKTQVPEWFLVCGLYTPHSNSFRGVARLDTVPYFSSTMTQTCDAREESTKSGKLCRVTCIISWFNHSYSRGSISDLMQGKFKSCARLISQSGLAIPVSYF